MLQAILNLELFSIKYECIYNFIITCNRDWNYLIGGFTISVI